VAESGRHSVHGQRRAVLAPDALSRIYPSSVPRIVVDGKVNSGSPSGILHRYEDALVMRGPLEMALGWDPALEQLRISVDVVNPCHP